MQGFNDTASLKKFLYQKVMRTLAVFCGKEFYSVYQQLSPRLSKAGIDSVAVEQRDVIATFESRIADQFVAIPLMCKITKEVIHSAQGRLKLIHQWGVGLEGVDIPEATKFRIPVANTPF